MTGYTKLFACIIASTIWREPHEIRIVWITMLALKNKNGVVEASTPGLADLARVSIPECKNALHVLESPDEYSRTKAHEGRRIKPCEGGWIVLNHEVYREKMGTDERREYLREKQREYREPDVNTLSTVVNKGQQGSTRSTRSTHAESDADAKETPNGVELIYAEYPRKVGRPVALRAITKAVKRHGYAKVFSATVAYAKAVATKDQQFIPHPSTWYNSERYNDDPKTWQGSTHKNIRTATACAANAGTANESGVHQYR